LEVAVVSAALDKLPVEFSLKEQQRAVLNRVAGRLGAALAL
jgi:hypothetical protein